MAYVLRQLNRFYILIEGKYETVLESLVSSIPRLDAASISIKSIAAPSLIDVPESEITWFEFSIRSLQFRALAKILQ